MNDGKALYVSKTDREMYELTIGTRLGADNVPEKVYQLKNEIHYWETTDQKAFENEFKKF